MIELVYIGCILYIGLQLSKIDIKHEHLWMELNDRK